MKTLQVRIATPTDTAICAHYSENIGVATSERHFDLEYFQLDVLVFDGAPCADGTTVATIGLSSHVGQEILLACHSRQFSNELVALAGAVAKQMVESRERLQRGQVLGPAGPLLPSTRMEAFYVSLPAYFADELDPLVLDDRSHVHFFWLIPIYGSEARWILEHDTDDFFFEDMLVAQDPDLLDLQRPPIKWRLDS